MNISNKIVIFSSTICALLLLIKIIVFEESSFSIGNIILYFRMYNNTTKSSRKLPKLIRPHIVNTKSPKTNFTKRNKNKTSLFINPKSAEDFPYDEECFFNSYPNFQPSSNVEDFSILKSKEGKSFKTILSYIHAYQADYYFGVGHKIFETACCKEKRCFFTGQTNKIRLEEFDAVLIHFRALSNQRNLPIKRSKSQRWVFYEREPPWLSGKNIEKYEGIFNWTMTYRKDADITLGYGRVYSKSSFPTRDFRKFEREFPSSEVLKTKRKSAAILVSHCDVQSHRKEYIEMLQKYIKVDLYGNCGPLKCPKSRNNECYEMIERDYKFYLSFENSLCTDYITEKFFNILRYNIIPVVRGPEDYSSFAPPHSYIDSRKYEVLELATYLQYLDGNDTAYLEYFNWKKSYFSISENWIYHAGGFCDLCYKLHNDSKEKTYYNLKEWFYGKSKCYP